MGQFSWLDCDKFNEGCRPILDNVKEDVYVLIPKEFGGGYIHESEYDGYGNFGGHDIYDLVAEWNKDYITEDDIRKPERHRYGGLWDSEIENLKRNGFSDAAIKKADEEKIDEHYQAALYRYNSKIEKLKDFQAGKSDEYMTETYGDDWKRCLGIDVACYDKQNAGLKYPIKITHNKNLTYENTGFSASDPDQGWCYEKQGIYLYNEGKHIPYVEYYEQICLNIAREERCRDCASLVTDKYGNWICDECDKKCKNIEECKEWR